MYPFTNAGLQSKLTVMYNQTDQQLAIEADSVASDFKSWVSTNFTLDPYQQSYLNSVPAHSLKVWGYLYAAAFLQRSAISMSAIPNNPSPRRTKEICHAIPQLELKYDDSGMQTIGTIDINIDWALL